MTNPCDQAFVNFCNIQNAIKAIEAMKNHQDYQNVKIAYGKDRCGNPPRATSSTYPRKASVSAPHAGQAPPPPPEETPLTEGEHAHVAAGAVASAEESV